MPINTCDMGDAQYLLADWSVDEEYCGFRYWLGPNHKRKLAGGYTLVENYWVYIVLNPNGVVMKHGVVPKDYLELDRLRARRHIDEFLKEYCSAGHVKGELDDWLEGLLRK